MNADGRLQVLQDDPYLSEFENDLKLRQDKFNQWLGHFDGEGGLHAVAASYKNFGLHINQNGDVKYREWAPSAQALSLVSLHRSTLYIAFSYAFFVCSMCSSATSMIGTGISTMRLKINSVFSR